MNVYESEARLLFMRERAEQLANEMRAARGAARGGIARSGLHTMLRAIAPATTRVRPMAGPNAP